MLAVLVAVCVGCGELPLYRSDRPVLVWDEAGAESASPRVRHSFAVPVEVAGWGEHRTTPGELGAGDTWSVGAWRGGGRLELALPGDLGAFDGVLVRGRLRGAHRLELRLSAQDREERLIRNASPASAETGEWLLSPRDGGALHAATATLIVSGPDCELDSLAFVELPPAARLPGPGRERPVGLEGDVRVAVGLTPGRTLTAELRTHQAGDTLEFAVGRWPARPGDAAPAALLLEFETPQGVVRQPVELGDSPQWRALTLPLAGMLSGTRRVRLSAGADDGAPLALADLWLGQRARSAPTVLLITSDTHRGDHLGAARGAVEVRTPALDALAARGVLFEDCYAAINNTVPSHASLFTGLSPRDTRILSNFERLAPEAFTLGEAFRAAGYRVFGVLSAAHLGAREGNVAQGFDRLELAGDPADAGLAVRRLLGWVEQAEGQPLFVWVHLFDAHRPYGPPGRVGEDPGGAEPGDAERLRELYRAEVEYLDGELAALLEHPRLRAGVVAFTADHGELLDVPEAGFDHTLPLPGTLHVPLVLAWPGAPAGRRVRMPVELVDLGHTLLALAGADAGAFPGRDLSRALESEADSARPRFALGDLGVYATVAVGDDFLALQLGEEGRAGLDLGHHGCALFDRAADPDCRRDLARERPERARALRALLVDWLTHPEAAPLVEGLDLSPERVATLGALGYSAGDGSVPGRDWIDPDCDCAACAVWREAR